MTLTFLDFFSGVGGFRHGLELAGMKCVGFCEEVDSFLHLLNSSKAKKKKINPNGFSLKMLRDFYQVAGDEIISTISLSWMKQGTTLNGKCSTQKTTEFPKTENVSTLSDILEVEVDEKYYLSAEKAVAILSNL